MVGDGIEDLRPGRREVRSYQRVAIAQRLEADVQTGAFIILD